MWLKSNQPYLAHALASARRTEWPAAIAALIVCYVLAFGFWSAS